MRIAALSDIHGNVRALEAVLADVARQGADVVVNLGDVLSGPLEPAATADLLMALGLPTVAGNHERQLLACEAERGWPTDRWTFERTTEAHRAWVRGLPATLALGDDAFLCHGTPASDAEYFLEDVGPGGAEAAPLRTVEERAGAVAHPLVLCGHSHRPRAVALGDGRLVVNPGSVGLPAYASAWPAPHVIENLGPEARYAICERGPAGWRVAFRAVAYPHERAAEAARASGREDWARWLATGRAS